MSNYYEILEVKTSASLQEIKAAYKKLALVHHPDRNGGKKESEERFKEVYEAYKTLSNQTRRQLYDRKLNLYKPSDINYNYHQGGFYSSIKKTNSHFSPPRDKEKSFVSSKKDIDFYLFYSTLALIILLISFFLIKF